MTFALDSLDLFAGTWRGGGEVAANPWGGSGPCRGAWSFRFDTARKAMVHDYDETRADGTTFSGHGVWCAHEDDLLWFWFDSYGFPPLSPSQGGWRDGALVLTKTTARGVGRSSWTCDGRILTYRVEAQPAGQSGMMQVMQGRFERVPGF